MVGFGETLAANIVSSWRDKYVRYELLKSVIEQLNESEGRTALSTDDLDVREVGQMMKVISAQSLLDLAERGDGKLALGARRRYSLVQDERGYGSLNKMSFHKRPLHDASSKSTAEALRSRFWAIIETDIARAGSHATSRTAVLRERLNVLREDAHLTTVRDVHAEVIALQDFVRLNGVALRKAVKKYDKTVGPRFGVDPALPSFMDRLRTEPLMLCAARLVELEEITIASLVSRDKLVQWRVEADAQGGPSRFFEKYNANDGDTLKTAWELRRKLVTGLVALALFIILLCVPCFPDDPVASRAAALVVLLICLWTTQAVPYHATAFAAPVLVVSMRVLVDNGQPMPPKEAGRTVLSLFFGSSTFLLLGGYALSASLSKCELEVLAADALRALSRESPQAYLLCIMLLGCLLSAVLSNSTAAVLCVSVLNPVLSELDANQPLGKALLLGLAFGCNAGGMLSPIASMQNIISVQALEQVGVEVPFGAWCAIAAPVALASTLSSWAVLATLLLVERRKLSQGDANDYVYPIRRRTKHTNTAQRYLVAVAAFLTVSFWSSGADQVGGVGIVSLAFMALAFGLGWLTVVDLNSLSWHTLCLLGASNVIGECVQSSRLLSRTADYLVPSQLPHPSVLACLVVACVSTISTFVSHTVTAIVVMPLVVQIATRAAVESHYAHGPAPLAMSAALAISAAQALPFSSLPNLNSLTKTDRNRRTYLTPTHFLQFGSLTQVFTALLVLAWTPIACNLFLTA